MSSIDQVCFDRLGFELLVASLKDTFGSAGESMIFQMSRNYGKYLIKSVKDVYSDGTTNGFEDSLKDHLGSVHSLGWGSFKYQEMDWQKGEFTIDVEENIFRESCKDGRDSMCFFIRGVMVGTMEEVANMELSIQEESCYKNGDSKCVFKMKAQLP